MSKKLSESARPSTSDRPSRLSARERLLAAAEVLFYEEGVNSVGIDRVIERAGVAKASLYATFGSKEELIRSYLASRQELRRTRLEKRLQQFKTPKERLLGVFDVMHEMMSEPSFRGCAFLKASAEAAPDSSVKRVCDESRDWMRGLFVELARAAHSPDPEGLARQLMLLHDGASVSAQMDEDRRAALTAREAAALLLVAAVNQGNRKPLGSARRVG